MKITDEVAKILKSYVYVYIDPRNGKPFYIEKAKGIVFFRTFQKSPTKIRLNELLKSDVMEKNLELKFYGMGFRIQKPVW